MQPRIDQSDISVSSSKTDEADLHLIVWLRDKSSNSTVQMLYKVDKNTESIRLQWLSIMKLHQNINLQKIN